MVGEMETVAAKLKAKGITVKIDDRDNVRSGFKFAEYELKGFPVRIVIGPRDLAAGTAEVMRRDTLEKETVPIAGIEDYVNRLLAEIQDNIYQKALKFRDSMITKVDTFEEFTRVLDEKGGFVLAPWDGTTETEIRIKEAYESDDTLHPVRFDGRGRRGYADGQTFAAEGAFRKELLISPRLALSRCKSGFRRGRLCKADPSAV